MTSTQYDQLIKVNTRLLAIIQNLESGNFSIMINDDGESRDVTKDNIKNFQFMQKYIESALHNEK